MDTEIQQPTVFSNIPHEYVFKRCTNSIFFVLATSVANYKPQILRHLKDNLHFSDEEANDIIEKHKISSGFVIEETINTYHILTTAHMFQSFYSDDVELSLRQMNRWFEVSVVCQHYEQNMARDLPELYIDPSVDPRSYSPVTIERFDSHKDLMLLRIPKNHLYADNNYTVCQAQHRPIPLCGNIPTPPSDVIMLAWPPCRRDTPLTGRIISNSRVYGQITQNLEKGYNMNLFELDITGDDGCSGGPILNPSGELHCVYHGRSNSVGYGIAASEVSEFLGWA